MATRKTLDDRVNREDQALRAVRLRPQCGALADGGGIHDHLSGGAVEVRSAGSAPAETINPAVREAMLEEGIDISAEKPKILTTEAVQASDVVITMGCGDTCPYFPGKRYLDWVLEDPAGRASRRCARSATRSRLACSACSVSSGSSLLPSRGAEG
jgi:protein-tyrosine-phosphatase